MTSTFSSAGRQGRLLDFGDEDADLCGLDLSGRSFVETVFGGQDLSGADLSGCDLYRANFFKTNLSLAKLIGSFLAKVKLDRACATGAIFDQADLTSATFYNTDLRKASFRRAWHCFTEYYDADLRGASFRESDFDRTSFDAVVVDRPDFFGALGTIDSTGSWIESEGARKRIDKQGFVNWLNTDRTTRVQLYTPTHGVDTSNASTWRWRPDRGERW